jgi:hypothetical protein
MLQPMKKPAMLPKDTANTIQLPVASRDQMQSPVQEHTERVLCAWTSQMKHRALSSFEKGQI